MSSSLEKSPCEADSRQERQLSNCGCLQMRGESHWPKSPVGMENLQTTGVFTTGIKGCHQSLFVY